MRAGWRKIVRDSLQDRVRSGLAVAAVAVGVAAFTAVLSSYAILERELNRGYLATNPASATILLDAIDDALMDEVRAVPGVQAAEARLAVSGRIKTGPAQWRNLTLFVVRDYADIRVSTITHEAGAWPPGPGEILIERDAFQVARTRIGEKVVVRLPKGTDVVLEVTGRVHDVGQAQARMENVVYGYATLDTLALAGEPPVLDQLKIVVDGDRRDARRVEEVVSHVKAAVEARGRQVRRIDIPEAGEHPHAKLMGMLLLAISSLGLLALALSGVLVVNLLAALLAAQVRQVGVMKAVGGTRRQIATLYLGQALLFGVAAVAAALPIGLLGGRALCRSMSVFLNFDITSFAVPGWVYLLVVLVGVATPLAAAWRPVARGVGLPVSEALAEVGVAGRRFGAGGLDRALAGVGGLTRPLLLAVRNGFRRRMRLALTVLTLSVSGLFFMSALNIRTSMIDALDRMFATKRYDLALNLGTMIPIDRIERAALTTPGVRRAEGWIAAEGTVVEGTPSTPGTPLHDNGGPHGGGPARRLSVLGVQPGTEVQALEIGEGRDLRSGDTDAIVVNGALAGLAGVTPGGRLVLRMGPVESSWRVVGISREAFTPPAAYVPRTYFERAGGHLGMANTVRVAADRPEQTSIERIREDLDRSFDREGIRILSGTITADTRFSFDQHMVMIYVFLVVMSAIFAAVGGLGLATTMTINVLERRREMGVLRAIGATPRAVGLIVIAEGLVVGLISFALAAIAAWPISQGLGRALASVMFNGDLDVVVDRAGLVVWLVGSLILSAVASVVPAWRASRAPVREAVACE